jgi:hypothetical protein
MGAGWTMGANWEEGMYGERTIGVWSGGTSVHTNRICGERQRPQTHTDLSLKTNNGRCMTGQVEGGVALV